MKTYKDFLYDTAKELRDEYYENESAYHLEYNIKDLPSKEFKFTCHLDYEYEIIIENIQILYYPLSIKDTYIHCFIKEIPTYIKGIRYDIVLLHNGSGISKTNQFSDIDGLYGSLITDFYYLFGKNYFDTNFIRNIGQEKSEE